MDSPHYHSVLKRGVLFIFVLFVQEKLMYILFNTCFFYSLSLPFYICQTQKKTFIKQISYLFFSFSFFLLFCSVFLIILCHFINKLRLRFNDGVFTMGMKKPTKIKTTTQKSEMEMTKKTKHQKTNSDGAEVRTFLLFLFFF